MGRAGAFPVTPALSGMQIPGLRARDTYQPGGCSMRSQTRISGANATRRFGVDTAARDRLVGALKPTRDKLSAARAHVARAARRP